MKKGSRIEIAEETLKIIEKGFYQTTFGEVISIKEEMAAAIASSRLFRLDDFPAEVSLTKAFAETRFEVTDETTIDASKLKIRYFRTTPQQADGAFARKLVGHSTNYHEFLKTKNLTPFQG